MNKNDEKLESFSKYCFEHPEERFWQALRNWAQIECGGGNYIMTGNELDNLQDTFYWD
jgi:hypothetical protein